MKVLQHHVYPGARAGSLYNVYVKVGYADGRTSGREMLPATLLTTCVAKAALLTYVTQTSRGAKIEKYMYPRVRLKLAGA